MKQANIDYLNQNMHHWLTLRDAGYVTNLSGETAKELLRILREEWDPLYQTVLHHMQNVCILIEYVYTRFERVLATGACERGDNNCGPVVGAIAAAQTAGEVQINDKVKTISAAGFKGKRRIKRSAVSLVFRRTDSRVKMENISIRPPPHA